MEQGFGTRRERVSADPAYKCAACDGSRHSGVARRAIFLAFLASSMPLVTRYRYGTLYLGGRARFVALAPQTSPRAEKK